MAVNTAMESVASTGRNCADVDAKNRVPLYHGGSCPVVSGLMPRGRSLRGTFSAEICTGNSRELLRNGKLRLIQPEGLSAISPGSSEAIPGILKIFYSTPTGVAAGCRKVLRTLQVQIKKMHVPGCRYAQSGANGSKPSGLDSKLSGIPGFCRKQVVFPKERRASSRRACGAETVAVGVARRLKVRPLFRTTLEGPILGICLFALTSVSFGAEDTALPIAELNRDKPVDFATEVYPALKANCLACHNTTKAKANLILESPEDMLKGGDLGPALEPGNAEVSLVFTTAAHIEEPLMPPANNKSKARNLNPTELALLKRWINEGAKGNRVMTSAPENWLQLSRDQPILASAVSARGRFAAAARGQYIDIYDLPRKRLVASLKDSSLKYPVAHRGRVQSLAFHPEGNALVSGGYRTAKVWQRPEESSVSFAEFSAVVETMVRSADRKSLALGLADGTVILYHADKPEQPLLQEAAHKGKVTSVAISKDQKLVYSTGVDKKLVRSEPGKGSTSVDLDVVPSTMVTFGQHQLLMSGQSLQIFSSDLNKHSTHTLRAKAVFLRSLVGANHEILVGFENGEVDHLKFDSADLAKAPQKVRTIAHGSPLIDLEVSSGHVATAGAAGPVKVWNLQDGKLLLQLNSNGELDWQARELAIEENIARRLEAHWKKLIPVEEALSAAETKKSAEAAGEIAQARRDLAAKWKAFREAAQDQREEARAATDDAESFLERLVRGRNTAARLAGEALSRKLAAESQASEAAALGAALKAEKETLAKEQSEQRSAFAVTGIDFNTDGTILTAALKDGGLRSWALPTGDWLEDSEVKAGAGMLYLTNSELLIRESDKKLVKLALAGDRWQLAQSIGNGSEHEPFSGQVTSVSYDPTGTRLIAASGTPSRQGEIMVFDTANFKLLEKNSEAHRDSIYALACSPDGKHIVSGGADRIVKTFDITSLRNVQNFEGHADHILDVDWTSDGLFLVSGGADAEVKYWNLAANQVERTVKTFKNEVVAVSIARGTDGLLTADGEGRLTFANAAISGIGKSFLHTAEVSAGGDVFVSGGRESVLVVLDGRTRKPIVQFGAPNRKQ